MAAYTPKRLCQVTLGTSSAAAYTAPGGTSCIVKTLVLANTSAVSVTATVYLIPSPGSVASNSTDATTVVPAVAIPAFTTQAFVLNQVMNTADILAAKASIGASVTLTGSGVEIV